MSIQADNVDMLLADCNGKSRELIQDITAVYSTIKWRTVRFVIPTEPVPSHRPRVSGFRFYVPGAAKNAAFFNKTVRPTLRGLFITTPCKFKLDIYVKTPKSFTKTRKILAEQQLLRPWGSTGDVDNYEKAVYDMLQPNEKRGNAGCMSNDSLIIESHTNKYYSVTPRYEVAITYMTNIPNSLIRLMQLGIVEDE